MTIKEIRTARDRAIGKADGESIKTCLATVQYLLKILHDNKFGGDEMHLCTGMGRSILVNVKAYAIYTDDSQGMVDFDVDFYDYIEPNSRKCATITMNTAVRKAVKELYEISEFLEMENLTTLFPYRVFHDRTVGT